MRPTPAQLAALAVVLLVACIESPTFQSEADAEVGAETAADADAEPHADADAAPDAEPDAGPDADAEPPPQCLNASDCDDGDPCTLALCKSQTCEFRPTDKYWSHTRAMSPTSLKPLIALRPNGHIVVAVAVDNNNDGDLADLSVERLSPRLVDGGSQTLKTAIFNRPGPQYVVGLFTDESGFKVVGHDASAGPAWVMTLSYDFRPNPEAPVVEYELGAYYAGGVIEDESDLVIYGQAGLPGAETPYVGRLSGDGLVPDHAELPGGADAIVSAMTSSGVAGFKAIVQPDDGPPVLYDLTDTFEHDAGTVLYAGGEDAFIQAISRLGDGSYLAVGQRGPNSEDADVWLVLIAPDGTVAHETTYDMGADANGLFIAPTEPEGAYVTVDVVPGGSDPNLSGLLWVDRGLNVHWSKVWAESDPRLGLDRSSVLDQVLVHPEGGLITAGAYDFGADIRYRVRRVSAWGDLSCEADNPCIEAPCFDDDPCTWNRCGDSGCDHSSLAPMTRCMLDMECTDKGLCL